MSSFIRMHSEIPNTFQIQYKRFYGVTVSTLDFESSNPSSNLGRTFFDAILIKDVIFSLLEIRKIMPGI
jgi:hypothetical protein